MAEIYEEKIPHFLTVVLSNPASSLPKGAQWVVVFDDPQSIVPGIKKALDYEPAKWDLQAMDATLNENLQQKKGCVFCHAIGLPGDSTTANVEGNIVSNGFIRPYVGGGRNQFPTMRMSFLETNASFADNFLRGWSISTSTFGMLARSKDDPENYRTNLYCYKLGVSGPNNPPYVLMKMSFFDICCISVSEEEYNYQNSSSPVLREAQFIYNYYQVETQSFATVNNSLVNNNLKNVANVPAKNVVSSSKSLSVGTTRTVTAYGISEKQTWNGNAWVSINTPLTKNNLSGGSASGGSASDIASKSSTYMLMKQAAEGKIKQTERSKSEFEKTKKRSGIGGEEILNGLALNKAPGNKSIS